jgi:hypothetical protein
MTSGEGFEAYTSPQENPELAEYLRINSEVDPATVLVMSHIPQLLGGVKSGKFIIQEQEAAPDTPPDPDAVIDLSKVAIPAQDLQAFGDFFEATEAQANAQYEPALFEAQQVLAEIAERGTTTKTLFIPDTVNSTAKGYFRRLTRLAQDMNVSVVMRVVDYDDGEAYVQFKRFDPIRGANIEAYWAERAHKVMKPHMPTIEPEYDDEVVLDALATMRLPTSAYWSEGRHEHIALSNTTYSVAHANTSRLRQWLRDENSPLQNALPIIREAAFSATPPSIDTTRASARVVLAKLGDEASLQTILQEIRDQTGSYGSESHTIVPLGIYMRNDQELLTSVMEGVERTIADDPGGSHELLPLLGSLYHSYDLQIGETLANHLIVPDRNAQAYARTVLHAAARWMPTYVAALETMSPSPQRDATLALIQQHTVDFLDAYNQGRLDGIYQYMMFQPDFLVPMLFRFHNPEHQTVLRQCVLSQFEKGGFVLNDSGFEQMYLQYREQYGDLPEISQLLQKL